MSQRRPEVIHSIHEWFALLNARGGCQGCGASFVLPRDGKQLEVEDIMIMDSYPFDPATGHPSLGWHRTVRETRAYHHECIPPDLIVNYEHGPERMITYAEWKR